MAEIILKSTITNEVFSVDLNELDFDWETNPIEEREMGTEYEHISYCSYEYNGNTYEITFTLYEYPQGSFSEAHDIVVENADIIEDIATEELRQYYEESDEDYGID